MSSEPTDPRIAEIASWVENDDDITKHDPRRDILFLLQRLEQVTAERDTLADRLGTTEGSLALVRKRAEAAEATIASLRETLVKHDAAVPLSTHTKAWKDGARWAFEKVRASLPSSAVSPKE